MITRFTVLPDDRGIILGKSKNNVFEPGYVYEAFEMLDEIVIRKIGPSAMLTDMQTDKSSSCWAWDANTQITQGFHLILMTQSELDETNPKEIIEDEESTLGQDSN